MQARFGRLSPLLFLAAAFAAAPASAAAQETIHVVRAGPPSWFWISLGVVLLAVLGSGIGIVLYLWQLQKGFLQACRDGGALEVYARNPAGVPAGTVRALLALFLVLATVVFLSLAMMPLEPKLAFPEMMTAVLGTVLGFYFGNRAVLGEASGRADRVPEPMPESAPEPGRRDRRGGDRAAGAGEAGGLEAVRAKVRDGVEAARTVAKVLPADLAKRVDRAADRIDAGLEVVDALREGGDADAALEEVGRLADKLRGEDPVRGALLRAAGSFARTLGGTVPPLAVAMSVVGVGARLAGAAYDRWVARVLHAPYTPELFPPSVVDANTGLSLLAQCPAFGRAFGPEVAAGDRAFAKALVERALSEGGVEELWREYADRFEDRAAFDAGVDEFQRAAIGREVLRDVREDWAAEAGGVGELLAAVDRLHGDEAARRDLDAIVLMADELKRGGRSPERVFREAGRRAAEAA